MNRDGLTIAGWNHVIAHCARRAAALVDDAWSLGVGVSIGPEAVQIIDCGVTVPGSYEAGRQIVELAQGGLACAHVETVSIGGVAMPQIVVESQAPWLSAYGLQVSVPLTEVSDAIRVSGPVVALFQDTRVLWADGRPNPGDEVCVAIVETNELPSADVVAAISESSGFPPERLVLVVVPTRSVAGCTQVAGRINECVLFTLEECLGIPSTRVTHLIGSAPIAPPWTRGVCGAVSPDDLIHYAGRAVVTMHCDGGIDPDHVARNLAFESAPMCGQSFRELLAEADGVFEAIPRLSELNRVAQVSVIDQDGGAVYSAGRADEELVAGWMRQFPKDRRCTR